MARRRRKNPSAAGAIGGGFLGALLGYATYQLVKQPISYDPNSPAAGQAASDLQHRAEIGSALAGAGLGMAAGYKLLP